MEKSKNQKRNKYKMTKRSWKKPLRVKNRVYNLNDVNIFSYKSGRHCPHPRVTAAASSTWLGWCWCI